MLDQVTKPKSLDEWADTREQFDDLSKHPIFGDAVDKPAPGYAYEGGYIEGPVNGEYYLIITNEEWTSTSLERLEGILYECWVKGEVYA